MVSSDDVLHFLREVDFPASREQLVDSASASEAPAEVRRALLAMPNEVYGNRVEVARSVRTDDDKLTPAEHAARGRDKKHSRIAEALRERPAD